MFSFLSTFSMCTQLRFCVRVATRLADLYTCKFDKFRKNSSRNVLLAIDYLPFYIMFFNISVLFRCNTKQECCVALSICTKSWFVYGISWFILTWGAVQGNLQKQPILILFSSQFFIIIFFFRLYWLFLHEIYMLHLHCSFSFRGPQVRLASLY